MRRRSTFASSMIVSPCFVEVPRGTALGRSSSVFPETSHAPTFWLSSSYCVSAMWVRATVTGHAFLLPVMECPRMIVAHSRNQRRITHYVKCTWHVRLGVLPPALSGPPPSRRGDVRESISPLREGAAGEAGWGSTPNGTRPLRHTWTHLQRETARRNRASHLMPEFKRVKMASKAAGTSA